MNETLTWTSDANASGRGCGYTFLDTPRVPDLGKPYGSVFEICISTGTHEDHIFSKQAPHALMGFQQGDGFAQDTPNCTARSSLIRPSCNSGITGVAMVKVIPRIRLRVKTPARATPRRPAKQKPRFRRDATLNPPPDLTVSRVLLPQVQPCDIILEHKKFHLTKVELDPWM